MKDAIEKGKSLVEERTQALEQWFDEKVERGRAALSEKPSFFTEWLIKEDGSADLPDIFSTLFNSINIMQFEIAKSSLRHHPPDILLSPELGKVRLLDFDKAEECIREGERVVRAALPEIKKCLSELKLKVN